MTRIQRLAIPHALAGYVQWEASGITALPWTSANPVCSVFLQPRRAWRCEDWIRQDLGYVACLPTGTRCRAYVADSRWRPSCSVHDSGRGGVVSCKVVNHRRPWRLDHLSDSRADHADLRSYQGGVLPPLQHHRRLRYRRQAGCGRSQVHQGSEHPGGHPRPLVTAPGADARLRCRFPASAGVGRSRPLAGHGL